MYNVELNELTTIVNSQALQKIITLHQEALQEKVNAFIRNGKTMEAYGELCKLDDANKLIRLVKQRIEEIHKEGVKDG